jgi:hypothetical protein
MNYTLYEPDTGQILSVVSDLTLAKGNHYILGSWSGQSYYIKDKQAKLYPTLPGPSTHYSWNFLTESWQFNSENAARNQRLIRDTLLSAVDRVNPIWYVSLGVERQVALQEYRQALLSVPEQPGFPESVIWPTRPPWL